MSDQGLGEDSGQEARPQPGTSGAENPSGARAARLCKGVWSLGTACGKCRRCAESAKAQMESLERVAKSAIADADMYARAWQRELNPFGFVNKRHHIDAMVLTTRKLVAEAVLARRTLATVEQWKIDAATARTLGVAEPDLLAALNPVSSPSASIGGS